jgi:hypothetical protein
MKYILSVKTLYDNNNKLTYVITKYNDNSAAVKIYKKEFESNSDKYIKTLKLNSLLNM